MYMKSALQSLRVCPEELLGVSKVNALRARAKHLQESGDHLEQNHGAAGDARVPEARDSAPVFPCCSLL